MSHLLPPTNIGEMKTITSITGRKRSYTILDTIFRLQSTYSGKAVCLHKLRWEDDGSIELRLGYYIRARKEGPRKGKWMWGQSALMIPIEDLKAVLKEATEKGWFDQTL
jgi:hypothetical protein